MNLSKERSCDGKRGYKSIWHVKQAVEVAKIRGLDFRFYRCQYCRSWHLAMPDNGDKRRIIAEQAKYV